MNITNSCFYIFLVGILLAACRNDNEELYYLNKGLKPDSTLRIDSIVPAQTFSADGVSMAYVNLWLDPKADADKRTFKLKSSRGSFLTNNSTEIELKADADGKATAQWKADRTPGKVDFSLQVVGVDWLIRSDSLRLQTAYPNRIDVETTKQSFKKDESLTIDVFPRRTSGQISENLVVRAELNYTATPPTNTALPTIQSQVLPDKDGKYQFTLQGNGTTYTGGLEIRFWIDGAPASSAKTFTAQLTN